MGIVYGQPSGAPAQQEAPPALPQAYAPAPPQVGVPPLMAHQYVEVAPNMVQGPPLMPLPPSAVPQQQLMQQNPNYATAQGYSIQPNYQMPQNPVQSNMMHGQPQPQAQLQPAYQMPTQQPLQVGNPGAMEMQAMPQQAMPQQTPQAVNLQTPPANIHTVRNQQAPPQTTGSAAPAAFVAGRKLRQQASPPALQPAPQQVQQQVAPQAAPQQVQQQAAQEASPQRPFSEAPTVGNDRPVTADTVGGTEAPTQDTPGTVGAGADVEAEESSQQPSGVPISHSGQIEGVGDRSNNWMRVPLGSREEVEIARPVFGPMYGQQVTQRDPEDGKEKVIYDPYTRRHAVGSPTGVAQQPTYGIDRVHSGNVHKAYQNRGVRQVSGAIPFGARYTNPQQIPTGDALRGYIGQ